MDFILNDKSLQSKYRNLFHSINTKKWKKNDSIFYSFSVDIIPQNATTLDTKVKNLKDFLGRVCYINNHKVKNMI